MHICHKCKYAMYRRFLKRKKNTEKFQIIQFHLKSTEDLSERTKGDMSHTSPPVSYSLVFSTVDLVCR